MHSKHDLVFNIVNEGEYDFEYSDIGYCHEESLQTTCIPTNQVSLVTSEELKTNAYQSRSNLSNQGNEEKILKGDHTCILHICSNLNVWYSFVLIYGFV
jgi:hypothetical protein